MIYTDAELKENRERLEALKKLFCTVPPDWVRIREELAAGDYSEKDLTELALAVTDECFCEYRDALDPEVMAVTEETMYSRHVVTALEILLEYGLNPNRCIDGENPMENTLWMDAPSVGARALRLLLEHGGDPNLLTGDDPETLFEYSSFKVAEDVDEKDYLCIVQCWWVLLAYGGCYRDGSIPIVMLKNRDVSIFKDFERFCFTIERGDPENIHDWKMHIYDRETREEVARY